MTGWDRRLLCRVLTEYYTLLTHVPGNPLVYLPNTWKFAMSCLVAQARVKNGQEENSCQRALLQALLRCMALLSPWNSEVKESARLPFSTLSWSTRPQTSSISIARNCVKMLIAIFKYPTLFILLSTWACGISSVNVLCDRFLNILRQKEFYFLYYVLLVVITLFL